MLITEWCDHIKIVRFEMKAWLHDKMQYKDAYLFIDPADLGPVHQVSASWEFCPVCGAGRNGHSPHA